MDKMHRNPSNARKTPLTTALSAFALAAALALSGCHDLMGDDQLSYEDARAASGSVLQPEEESALRLGVIHPENPGNVSTGRLDVVVLLFDEVADQPVEDAGITIDGFMPMHGHGTSPEQDPAHEGEGVYSGYTTLSMGGDWEVYLNATLADGSGLSFTLDVHAMGDGDMDGMDHDMDGEMDDGMDDGMDHGNMSASFSRLPVTRS